MELLVEIEVEFEEVTIIQAIPGCAQVLTGSVLTRAFPRFNAESGFTENFPNFVLES